MTRRSSGLGLGLGLTGKPLLYFTSTFVSLGFFLFGYDQGVMSGIILGTNFNSYFNQPSKAEIGTMFAILEVGAVASSLMVGRIGDVLGRRRTIFYGSCVVLFGGALQSMAGSMLAMMAGRLVAGAGLGVLTTMIPIYQSEISPAHSRGQLACIEFTINVVGYSCSLWLDYFCGFLDTQTAWRLPLLGQCLMAALLAAGSLLLVESPRWLLDHDLDDQGLQVMADLYGTGDTTCDKIRDEFREIKRSVLRQRHEAALRARRGRDTKWWSCNGELFGRYRRRILTAVSAQILAQLNGINVISYYAPYVFEQAGWRGHDAILMTGINSVTYVLSTIPTWFIVDSWGRRPVLLSGAVIMAVALSATSLLMWLEMPGVTSRLVVVAVIVYNGAFGYSWGPITWLYAPEILPQSVRSRGASISTASNWAANWLVGQVTPVLQQWIEWRLYLVHAFFCVLSYFVVYFLYPETCGLRLEEMDVIFGDYSPPESHMLTQSLNPTSSCTEVADGDDDGDMYEGGGDYRSQPRARVSPPDAIMDRVWRLLTGSQAKSRPAEHDYERLRLQERVD